MRVAIIGFQIEGQSALRYWQTKGADVTVCSSRTNLQLPEGVTAKLGEDYLANLDGFDVIMRSASIKPRDILALNPGVESKITTVIDEFIRVSPSRHIVGVTGTKGKGTTSTLIAKMLEASGKQVFLGGNIGVSPLDFLPEVTEDSWVVLELSSFQLFDIKHSPHIAVCLMITPEHQDWHTDEQDYYNAKQRLFAHQTSEDIAIYLGSNPNSKQIATASPGKHIPFFEAPGAFVQDGTIVINGQAICKTSELKLRGEHNWQNACAATTAVWQVEPNVEAIRSVLTSFSGLPHRLEFVRELENVQYIDDSFGTTPETAVVAIKAFQQPKVVILGGSDKGIPFDQLAQTVVENNVRKVVLIGATAPKIRAALDKVGFTDIIPGGKTMSEIIQTARSQAQPGDIVLLSPGCASFDMFDNYKDRAAQFTSAVQALS